ncbi:MAG: hypothetical protein LM572_01230 [Ignisphaera sp.]|jgi:hypothetical protein|nr:hypothetical protein [Ignisphaera sp.]MCC6055964.1 hypothetical protein [Desulfurococcaceae archaeon]
MLSEDWKTYKRIEAEIKKTLSDDIHEFLTKIFNVYIVRFGIDVFKRLEDIRDKLIPLTTRFDNDKYTEFCDTFSKAYRSILLDKDIDSSTKMKLVELAQKTNAFFGSKGLSICVKELKYYKVKVKTIFKGQELNNAIVSAESEGRVVASSKTNDAGICEIEVPEGRYTVYVYKDLGEGEYIYDERIINVPQEIEVVFNISETKTRTEIEKERGGRPIIKEVS